MKSVRSFRRLLGRSLGAVIAAVSFPILNVSTAEARLTSDFDTMAGFSLYRVVAVSNELQIEAPLGVECSYNLNYENWRTAFSLVFSEAISSSQGSLAITRFGIGAKYFLMGFPSQRVIIDSRTEGRIWKAAPYAGLTTGISNFSVADLGDGSGRSFNAAVIDLQIKLGIEVPINPDWIFLAQTILLTSIGAAASIEKQFSYTGTGLLIGFKLTSF